MTTQELIDSKLTTRKDLLEIMTQGKYRNIVKKDLTELTASDLNDIASVMNMPYPVFLFEFVHPKLLTAHSLWSSGKSMLVKKDFYHNHFTTALEAYSIPVPHYNTFISWLSKAEQGEKVDVALKYIIAINDLDNKLSVLPPEETIPTTAPKETHSRLSPSGCSIWYNCTGSVELAGLVPQVETDNEFSIEGTLAHEYAQKALETVLEAENPTQLNDYFDDEIAKLPQHLKELEAYFNRIRKIINSYPTGETTTMVEVKFDLTELLQSPEVIKGTADCVIFAKDHLHVIDLKWGKGVEVDAYENKQLLMYAVGVLDIARAYDLAGQDVDITLHIVQPRIDRKSYSFYKTNSAYVDKFKNLLKGKILDIYQGNTSCVSGSHCRFCKGYAKCSLKKRGTEKVMEVLTLNADLSQVADNEIIKIYEQEKEITKFLKQVTKYVEAKVQEAEDNGLDNWNGYKKVITEGNREVSDLDALLESLAPYGITRADITKESTVGLTELDKLIKKRQIPKEEIRGVTNKINEKIVKMKTTELFEKIESAESTPTESIEDLI